MKIRIISSAFVATALLLGSCQKKVLDLQSYSNPPEEFAFGTPEAVQLSMYGVYDAAQSGFYLGGAVRGYPFGAANIEQGEARGEDMLNVAAFYQITYEATYNNASPNNGFMFQTIYSMVNKANLVIEGAQDAGKKGIITPAQALQYEAECRFLRAMGHHELVLNFSRPYADGNGSQLGVIYRDFAVKDVPTANLAKEVKRSSFTVEETYNRILADLDFAETNLPAGSIVNTSGAAVKTFRATKAAAIALKMRVKMHKGDWAGVVAEGNKIVPANAPFVSPIGGWTLNATVETAFGSATSNENLFSIKNDATDNPQVNGALPQMMGDPALGGRGLLIVSPIIWSDPRWLCNDLRRTTLYRTAGNPTNAVYPVKYRDYATSSDAAVQIRYSEVLLTLAEAEARLAGGVSARGVALLNAVRNRAVTNVADQFTVASFANKNALISAILFERRVELLAEGKRWGDIHRLAVDPDFAPVPGGGIPAKVGTGGATASMFNCAGAVINRTVAAIPYANFRFLWPIPIEETQQNPNYDQNPGY